MLLVSYFQQYFNTSITVLTNQVWKLLIALFKVLNTSALTVIFSRMSMHIINVKSILEQAWSQYPCSITIVGSLANHNFELSVFAQGLLWDRVILNVHLSRCFWNIQIDFIFFFCFPWKGHYSCLLFGSLLSQYYLFLKTHISWFCNYSFYDLSTF